MAITGVNSYNSIYENTYAASGKEAAKKISKEEYLKSLQKQVPYMKLQIGYGLNTNNDGKVNVLEVNPKFLEKMQRNPKIAEEYTQRLKDIEAATKWVDGFEKSMGYTAVVRHGYVDENGNFSNFAVVVRKDELNEKLRKEAQENTEKQMEKTRENVRKKAEQLSENMAEKAERLLSEKLADSDNGEVYLDNNEMQLIADAAKERTANKTIHAIGQNLDYKI